MPVMRPAKKPKRSFTDLNRKIRKAERETGATFGIDLLASHGISFVAIDPELEGRRFYMLMGAPSKHEYNLKQLHEAVYHARGEEKLRQQGFKCALCHLSLDGTSNTSIDHIESRGAHGRNDRMDNLRVVHENPCHRERHGG